MPIKITLHIAGELVEILSDGDGEGALGVIPEKRQTVHKLRFMPESENPHRMHGFRAGAPAEQVLSTVLAPTVSVRRSIQLKKFLCDYWPQLRGLTAPKIAEMCSEIFKYEISHERITKLIKKYGLKKSKKDRKRELNATQK